MSGVLVDPVSLAEILAAPARASRPNAFASSAADETRCPFCPGHESDTPPEVWRDGTGAEWTLRVVPNRYPIVAAGQGFHEVIIETPRHEAPLLFTDSASAAATLRAAALRMQLHARDSSIASSVWFKNDGAAAGASLEHPHSQLLSLTFVPSRIQRVADAFSESCPICRGGAEVVLEAGDMILTATSSRFPWSFRVAPREHSPRFEDASEASLDAAAALIASATRALRSRFPAVPMNLIAMTAPRVEGSSVPFHWHIDVIPRLTGIGGLELATDLHVSIVDPRQAASELRQAIAGEGR